MQSGGVIFAQSNGPSSRLLSKLEIALFEADSGRGRLLERCRMNRLSVTPTSVQAERDFSVFRYLVGENRSCLIPDTLDTIFLLFSLEQSKVVRNKP